MANLGQAVIDSRQPLERALEEWHEPGARELRQLLHELLGGEACADQTTRLDRLKKEVYRLRIGDGSGRTLVLKRLAPVVAQTDRLVAQRWLPALGLGTRCPQLLGAAAQRSGGWVWHVYEDIGHETLAVAREERRLAAAVDLIAQLHTSAAGHPLLPEVRWRGRDYGAHFFTANLRDAIAALEALATFRRNVPPGFPASRERLLVLLHRLLEDAPRRSRALAEAGGPDTLLHGDLWPNNVFVPLAGDDLRARLIDWDHVGVGPFSYDVSTFLYQSPVAERPWIVQRYGEAVGHAGWRLPEREALNLLCHTAESARYAHCIVFDAMAVLHDGVDRAIKELMDYERWLEALRPPLPD